MIIPELEYDCETNSAYKITQVALANGLDKSVARMFAKYVEEAVNDHIDYRMWVDYMGDDL